jgi:hypothetical protein
VVAFLNANNSPNLHDFVFKFLNLVNGTNKNQSDGYFEYTSLVKVDDSPSKIFFNSLCIDIEDFKNSPKKQKEFFGLKESPVYKFNDSSYLIFDWNFMFNQIYNGLVFNFFNVSGISEVFNSIPNFKSFVGENISEKNLFKKIMQYTLHKKHSVIRFDDDGEKGRPDLYCRDNKKLFLFEFKDYMLASDVIDNSNFGEFKNEVDKKFVQSQEKKPKPKGVLQLAEQIKFLAEKNYEFDSYEPKFKKSSISIYPIIVVTNPCYSIPGIEAYLNSVFIKKIEESYPNRNSPFNRINDVIIIQFDFFLKSFLELQSKKVDLNDVIDDYFKNLKKLQERASKDKMKVVAFLESNTNFEQLNLKYTCNYFLNKNYVKEIFRCLELVPEEYIH